MNPTKARSLLIILSATIALGPLAAQDRMDLDKSLASMRETAKERLSADTYELYQKGIRDVEKTALAYTALGSGAPAPDFSLPNAHNEPVSLAHHLQKGPVILIFYRGGWCPYCNLQLQAFQSYLDLFEENGAHLIAISPESPDFALETVKKDGLGFEVLSDHQNHVARKFGLAYTLPPAIARKYVDSGLRIYPREDRPGEYELPLAATYIIDTDGMIRYAHIQADYTRRPNPAEVLSILRQL